MTAAAVGLNYKTYEKAKAVVEAANEEPEFQSAPPRARAGRGQRGRHCLAHGLGTSWSASGPWQGVVINYRAGKKAA